MLLKLQTVVLWCSSCLFRSLLWNQRSPASCRLGYHCRRIISSSWSCFVVMVLLVPPVAPALWWRWWIVSSCYIRLSYFWWSIVNSHYFRGWARNSRVSSLGTNSSWTTTKIDLSIVDLTCRSFSRTRTTTAAAKIAHWSFDIPCRACHPSEITTTFFSQFDEMNVTA